MSTGGTSLNLHSKGSVKTKVGDSTTRSADRPPDVRMAQWRFQPWVARDAHRPMYRGAWCVDLLLPATGVIGQVLISCETGDATQLVIKRFDSFVL